MNLLNGDEASTVVSRANWKQSQENKLRWTTVLKIIIIIIIM